MPQGGTKKKVGELIPDARVSFTDLLQFDGMRCEHWFMRLSCGGRAGGWIPLTSDTRENDVIIRGRIAGSQDPVTDLVFAFVGTVDWRGGRSLMAHMQYFRRGYDTGLLFGSHLIQEGQKIQAKGNFLVMGGCRNIWI